MAVSGYSVRTQVMQSGTAEEKAWASALAQNQQDRNGAGSDSFPRFAKYRAARKKWAQDISTRGTPSGGWSIQSRTGENVPSGGAWFDFPLGIQSSSCR